VPIDEIDAALGAEALASRLEGVADDLRTLWSAATERREFAEVTRLVEASHAVHRAVIALRSEPVITGMARTDRISGTIDSGRTGREG
jgi:hypothetical protein